MKALIVDGANTYLSPIFAIKYKGWESEVIAFDSSYSFVKRIQMGIPVRRVFIVAFTELADKKGRWRGYEWLLKNKKLLRDLRRNKSVSVADYPEFKAFSQKAVLPEWLEVKDDNDIIALRLASFGFHDSTISRTNQTADCLEIVFDTFWDCCITVRFFNVIEQELVDKIGMILDSKIEPEENGLRWSVEDGYAGWIDGIDYNDSCAGAYIKCKKILWRIEIP